MKRNFLPVNCTVCGISFIPYEAFDRPRYCSKQCIWKGTKGQEFNAKIAKESAAARGDMQRNRGDGVSYRKLNGRHEHRIVAENTIGRPLLRGEVVHHIDGDKRNNSPGNLEVISQGEHMRRHGIGVPGVTPPWKPWEKRKAKS